MYKVVEHFKDLQDNRHEYNPGDVYPREGLKVSAERLAALSSNNNGMGHPMIVEEFMNLPKEPAITVKEPKEPEIIPKEPEKPKAKRGRKKNAD